MESVGSNSPASPAPAPTRRRPRRSTTGEQQGFADRVARALEHRLLVLHRAGPATFFVLGATGNVYTVSLSAPRGPTCTCPDRAPACKHLLFVLIRALGLGPADPCLRRLCHLSHLLGASTLPGSLAPPPLRRRFRHFLLFGPQPPPPPSPKTSTAAGCCPVCLEEMGEGKAAVTCRTCQNAVHEECHLRWKRSRGRRPATCVLCRARWQNSPAAGNKYLNLATYMDGDGDADNNNIDRVDDLCGV